MKYIALLILCLLAMGSSVTYTNDVNIKMEPADRLYGDTFDSETYGKNIMFLFWSNKHFDSKMFKTSAWDMLHTQKDLYVRSRYVMIGEVDCGLVTNKRWCDTFIAFNISGLNYPYIGYSYHNEPFKLYNGSMEYPALTEFLHHYFERNCAINKEWCSEQEEEYLKLYTKMTLKEKYKRHIDLSYETKQMAANFERWALQYKKNFDKKQKETQHAILMRDKEANLLFDLIQRHPEDRIKEVEDIIKLDAYNEMEKRNEL